MRVQARQTCPTMRGSERKPGLWGVICMCSRDRQLEAFDLSPRSSLIFVAVLGYCLTARMSQTRSEDTCRLIHCFGKNCSPLRCSERESNCGNYWCNRLIPGDFTWRAGVNTRIPEIDPFLIRKMHKTSYIQSMNGPELVGW